MTDNQRFLAEFVQTGSDAAFRELVDRYVNFVYSAALRLVEGDTHRAEDVTQTVFVDLSRMARTFSGDVMLGGWLHRHTCFVAANAMRAERRRQSRERQAVELNALQDRSGEDFSRIGPILDEAINELAEADRTAILLRFFEQCDFRAVGEELGSNEDAARMRVNRALGKLESLLKRRGITTTAATLGVIISANAVQAAPIGLAATIISASAISGTTLATITASTATKAIAMTTLQKTIIGTTLVIAVGAALYEAQHASKLRSELDTLRRQQTELTEQIQQTQQGQNEASNQLAAATDEIARLKMSPQSSEILKLRGEITGLRERLASVSSKTNASPSGFARMMNDPASREFTRQTMLKGIKSRYAALFQELQLKPEQIEEVAQLFADLYLRFGDIAAQKQGTFDAAEMERASSEAKMDFGKKLAPLIGKEGVARFAQFSVEIPARVTVQLLNDQLGPNQLDPERANRLLQIIKAEPYEVTHGIEGDMNTAFLGSKEQVDQHLQKLAESNGRILHQASNFLSADQVAALNTVLTNGVNARIAQAAVFGQKK